MTVGETTLMRQALAYARVSTQDQADRNLSIPAQVEAIRKFRMSLIFEHGNAWWLEHKVSILAEMEKISEREMK